MVTSEVARLAEDLVVGAVTDGAVRGRHQSRAGHGWKTTHIIKTNSTCYRDKDDVDDDEDDSDDGGGNDDNGDDVDDGNDDDNDVDDGGYDDDGLLQKRDTYSAVCYCEDIAIVSVT